MIDTTTPRDVLDELADAVKWWNAEEADEPDVLRLFARCKAEIERLRLSISDVTRSRDELQEIASWWHKLGEDITGRRFLAVHHLLPAAEQAYAEQREYAEELRAALAVSTSVLAGEDNTSRDVIVQENRALLRRTALTGAQGLGDSARPDPDVTGSGDEGTKGATAQTNPSAPNESEIGPSACVHCKKSQGQHAAGTVPYCLDNGWALSTTYSTKSENAVGRSREREALMAQCDQWIAEYVPDFRAHQFDWTDLREAWFVGRSSVVPSQVSGNTGQMPMPKCRSEFGCGCLSACQQIGECCAEIVPAARKGEADRG